MLDQSERERHERREKRKALFDAVLAAYQQGFTKRAIAKAVRINGHHR